MNSVSDRKQPLEGIRICDFFWLIAGPACSRIFADWGAEVIKIESSSRMDEIRQTGSWPPDDIRSEDSHNGVCIIVLRGIIIINGVYNLHC